MEKFRLLIVLGIAFLIGGQSISSQKENKKERVRREVREKIESAVYTIDVNRALPSGGRSVTLTSSYNLKIDKDSVYSYLPYFGRAYTIPYGGGKGLIFDGEIQDYSVKFDKKQRANIKFRVKTDEDSYTYYIQLFDNGTATIQVTPVNRQLITFYGNLDLTPEE